MNQETKANISFCSEFLRVSKSASGFYMSIILYIFRIFMLRRIPKQLQSCLQTILEGVDVDILSLLRLTSDVDPVRLNYFGSAYYALQATSSVVLSSHWSVSGLPPYSNPSLECLPRRFIIILTILLNKTQLVTKILWKFNGSHRRNPSFRFDFRETKETVELPETRQEAFGWRRVPRE